MTFSSLSDRYHSDFAGVQCDFYKDFSGKNCIFSHNGKPACGRLAFSSAVCGEACVFSGFGGARMRRGAVCHGAGGMPDPEGGEVEERASGGFIC